MQLSNKSDSPKKRNLNKFTNHKNQSDIEDSEVNVDLDRIRSVNPRMIDEEEEEIHGESSENVLLNSSKDDPNVNSSRIFSKLRNKNTTVVAGKDIE